MLPPPVTAFILSFTTFTLILGLTSSKSLLRPAFFPLMLIYVYIGSSYYHFRHPLYASLVGGGVFSITLHYIDTILLSRWTFSAKGSTSSRGGQTPILLNSNGNSSSVKPNSTARSVSSSSSSSSSKAWTTNPSRLWWTARHLFDCRFNGTRWEVANTPQFSRRDPTAVPSRISFVSYSAAVSVVCIFLLDAARLLGGPPEMNAVLFAQDRVGLLMRLGDVTAEEMVLRFVSVTMYWGITFILFQGVYSGVGAVMVGLGLSDVRRWKPLFGRLADAWSVRQFWG